MSSKVKYITITILSCFLLFYVIFANNYSFVVISGESMSPTFKNGDIVLIQKSYSELSVGDVITFRIPESWDKNMDPMYIKRVAALSGDTVKVIGGKLYVNNNLLVNIPYECPLASDTGYIMNSGEVFAMGDNTKVSNDSLKHLCKTGNYNTSIIKEHTITLKGRIVYKYER